MSTKLINGIDFQNDFKDGYISLREARKNAVDSELRGKVNSKECHQGDCVRLTETEVKDYIENRGDKGLLNLMILQYELRPSFFSPRAHQFLHKKAMEHLERIFPEVNFLSRDQESLTFLVEGKVMQHIGGSQAIHFEMPTGYSPEQSEVEKIEFFHDITFLDGAGLYLAIPDATVQKKFLPSAKQVVAVQEMIPELHEGGYSMEATLRVFQDDMPYVRVEAFRWRREGEDPTTYLKDEEGNAVPSDVQEVVLKINTATREVVDELPGQLP